MTDLIICWHESADYPIFRTTLAKYRSFFGKVIIYLSKHHREPVYSDFLKEAMKDLDITFLDPIEYEYGVEDWRNVATNHMLKFSDSEWVCSIEQDWFSKDWDKLFIMTAALQNRVDFLGWMNMSASPYIHPSYWFIKRSLLEQTSKDFSAHPEINGSDHFGTITYDVQKMGISIGTQEDFKMDFEFGPNADAFHLGGINQNYLEGLKEGYEFHRAEPFYVYNFLSAGVDAPMDPRFTEIIHEIDKKLKQRFPDIDPTNNQWTKFFKT